jgi:mono/diheme cytochrome c family protein
MRHCIELAGRSLAIGVLTLLAACSGGSGGGTEANRPPSAGVGGGGGFVYSGPAPADSQVQQFKINFYDNLVGDNRCGTCHTRGGSGPVSFVDRSDVNVAYGAALSVVNLANPAASPIVDKVGGGHNCWESSSAACRVQMISFIERWAAGSSGGATTVQLTQPVDRNPQGAKTFPADASSLNYGSSNLYALLRTYCSGCHAETAAIPQQPFFASANVDIAYSAVKSKVDLNNPARSRLVVRLRQESHNCWSNCGDNASEMQAAIELLAGAITAATIDPSLLISAGQIPNLDGIIASSGGRFEQNQIAFWQFREGSGNLTSDTSGVAPAINLTLTGDYEWVGGWGIQFHRGRAFGTGNASRKLYDRIATIGEYSIEAWVAPANVTQEGPAEILSYGDGGVNRNFLMGQTRYNYEFLNTSSRTNSRGEPSLSTADADEDLQATLQHVVMTYDPVQGRRIYVNGQFTGDVDPQAGATLADDWASDHVFILGGDLGLSRYWSGILRQVAIHNRALTPAQIEQNFEVGVGEKRFLLFNVSALLDPDQPGQCINGSTSFCYVVFQVSQYDSYSYLFTAPFFISLNPDFQPWPGLTIKGIRIGINGKLASVGQAFVNVNATIAEPAYVDGEGQPLSPLGTLIPLENGPESDIFYLQFDQIGSSGDQTPPPVVLPFAYSLTGLPTTDLAWRTFDEISASFAAITGVAPSDPAVVPTINTVRQQLPVVEGFSAFLASHQTAAAQLATAYCSALANNTSLRASIFPALDITQAPSAVGWRAQVVEPLVTRAVGSGLWGDVDAGFSTAVMDELDLLITYNGVSRQQGLMHSGATLCSPLTNSCRNREIVTATCSALLGSAVLTLQ